MSVFNFGAPGSQQPPTATTTAPSTGFSFGASTGGQTASFSFGAPRPPATGQQPAATGGLGGFGLGAPTTTTAAVASTGATTGFNFGATAATKAPATGFSFGANPPAASQPASTASFGFGLGQKTAAPSTGTGFSLGGTQAASTAATTSTAPSLSTGFAGFGTPAAAAATTSTPASTSAGGSLLSGLLTAPTTTTAATSSTGAAPTGFGFGAPTPASTAATTSTAGFNFGGAPTTTTQQTSGFGLSSFGTTSSAAPLSTATSTSIGLAGTSAGAGVPGNQKQMTYRQLEDAINKWSTELEEQEKYFLDQATQVNAWDRIVMENGEKIIQLNQDVEKVKMDQQKLDHELDFIHSQQRELEELLIPLEKPLDNMPAISYQQHADVEREHTYMLAESLDAQLKRMGQDLREIIERLNSNNSKSDQDDPVQQITKILNAHVVSLMWVDRNTTTLQKRIEDISRQMDFEKREQERNFRLAYS